MKLIKLSIISIALFFINNEVVKGQDLNFAQYFNAPLLVNPANTGFNPDYDFRIGGNYRNQWANVITNPFRTYSIWGDAQLFNNRFDNGWVGIGGALYRDEAGSGNLSSTRAYLSAAYHQMIGYDFLLSVGVGVGGVNKRVDPSKLTFDDQWNGKFFDIARPNNEPFLFNSTYYASLNAGLNFSWFVSDVAYVNVGYSMLHVNQPKETFFSPTAVSPNLSIRHTAFLNANFKIEDRWIVNPNIYVSTMAGVTETVLGVNANRNLSGEGGRQQLIVGAYYRLNDAIIPMLGLQTNNTRFTFSYDATTSSLNGFNNRQGAYEVSVVFSGIYGGGNGKAIKCPTVRF
jgi:type IX secretion system PorP/SprF family membrane protein